MNRYAILFRLFAILTATVLTSCRTPPIPQSIAMEAFADFEGTLVVVDCSSGKTMMYRPDIAKTPLPPCSTFKIVNTLVGLETGIIASPQERFYLWDGVERSVPAWNDNLSLEEAFQSSCVPAFQALARQIGPERMQHWMDRIGYGNRDLSAGIDVFWLPAQGRKTLLISPLEQAELMRRIIAGNVPFSGVSLSTLREIMFVQETDKGRLYGKTGSGANEKGTFVLGWFVGYVESQGKAYAFACAVQGENVMSKNARAIVEAAFKKQGLL